MVAFRWSESCAAFAERKATPVSAPVLTPLSLTQASASVKRRLQIYFPVRSDILQLGNACRSFSMPSSVTAVPIKSSDWSLVNPWRCSNPASSTLV